jgi:hypothetical protein
MTTSRNKPAIKRIKRKANVHIKRQRKMVRAAASGLSRTARKRQPRKAQRISRQMRHAKRSRKATSKAVRHYGQANDPLTAAVDQAIKVETNAVQMAGHLTLAGLDVIETATAIFLAPAVWLGSAFGGPSKTGKGKLLPWPAPTPIGVAQEPMVSSLPVAV